MKKTSTFLSSFLALCIGAGAQDSGLVSYMNDAMNWSSNDYAGSARTMGMGNAVTAVGGDIGSVVFNPGGSAVNNYSQFVLSPGLSFSIVSAGGVPSSDGNTYLAYNSNKTATRFLMPTSGVIFNFDLGNITGLKNWSIGFIATTTNKFNQSVLASGQNDEGTSTYSGCLAATATDQGYGDFDDLVELAWEKDVFGKNTAVPGGYAGVSENGLKDGSASLGGAIGQTYSSEVTGSKTDYILNMGFNWSDIVYFGFNVGISGLDYRYNYALFEDAVDPDFFQTGFNSLSHSYSYKVSGSGVYFKAGAIVSPIEGLRLGAAVQTPTRLNLVERYSHSLTNRYLNQSLTGTTEPGSWRFNLVSPWRFNVGAAYTIGKVALVSADYELVDFSTMSFREYYSEDLSYCNSINHVIQGTTGSGKCMGVSHLVRAGVEVRLTSEFAVRAGYNFTSSPECEMSKGLKTPVGTNIHAGTLGVGYDSPGAFFCDIAAKLSFRPDGSIKVYDDYTNRVAETSSSYEVIGGPMVEYRSRLLNVALTIGWRF